MNRRMCLWLLAAFISVPFLFKEASAYAPTQGSVFVKTLYQGAPAAYQPITIQRLQGKYPVPPGRYFTNGVGQIWIGLYPGVYRFSVTGTSTSPDSWDVNVASRGEYYIYFNLTSPPGEGE